jgi:hypothetical protein
MEWFLTWCGAFFSDRGVMFLVIAGLVTIDDVIRELHVSRSFVYRLPPGTPGVFRFGRSKRYDVELLKQWAQEQQREPGSGENS